MACALRYTKARPKEADPMTRRFLPAWLLMAVLATTAMMPTVANAQAVSTQNRFRHDQNISFRASDRGNAYVNTSSGNRGTRNSRSAIATHRQSGYRQPRVSQGFSTRVSPSFSTAGARSHGTFGMSWGNDRRR